MVRMGLSLAVCAAFAAGCAHTVSTPSVSRKDGSGTAPPGPSVGRILIDVHGPFGGNPLPDAVVEVSDSRGRRFRSVSNSKGEARFEGIPFGRYTVEVHHSQTLGQRLELEVAGESYQMAALMSPLLQSSPPGDHPAPAEVLERWHRRVPPVFVVEHRSGQPTAVIAVTEESGKYAAFVAHIDDAARRVIHDSERPLDGDAARAIICTWRTAIDRASPTGVRVVPEVLDGSQCWFATVENGRERTATTTTLPRYLDDGPRARALRLQRTLHEYAEGHLTEAQLGSSVAGSLDEACKSRP
jgi:hypothetical protein